MKAKVQKVWTDPVWSKVISAVIIALGGACYVAIEGIYHNATPIATIMKIRDALNVPIPLWATLLALFIALAIPSFRYRHLLPSRRDRKCLRIRPDRITGNVYEHMVMQYDPTMTGMELLAILKDSYKDEGLDTLEFGRDWYLIVQQNGRHPECESYKTLTKLGIEAGMVLEIYVSPRLPRK